MKSDALFIKNLKASVGDKPVLKGIDLVVRPGEVHAIMGPNGSGKSTLAYALAGHPGYEITDGEIELNGQSILDLSPDERSHEGLFLAFQYPVEVPGVRVQNFLRLAHQARFADQPDKLFAKVLDFRKHLAELAATLGVKKEFLSRGLNEGFSGGEKKRVEILQMATIEPKYAILDETDSGLDIDAIKAVAQGVRHVVDTYHTGVIVITHYQRILEYLRPDFVHVLVDGVIAESGDASLITNIEQHGYQPYLPKE